MAVAREDRAPEHPRRVVGVMHPAFRSLQNREGGELFDRLFDPGARKYHTGGYLRNGEVVWPLARLLPDPPSPWVVDPAGQVVSRDVNVVATDRCSVPHQTSLSQCRNVLRSDGVNF